MAIHHYDSVDRLIDEWRSVDPRLDVGVIGVVHRIRRVRDHLEQALEANFSDHGLTGTGFGVLSTLIRSEAPHEMSQRRLSELLHLTPGTVSIRIDKLEEQGLVERLPAPDDKRSVLVRLTQTGRVRFDQTAPTHLALQNRMLAALRPDEQHELALLLRKLLTSFEGSLPPDCPTIQLGLDITPAHVARKLQTQLGLAERDGLLVKSVKPDSEAEAAGIENGDLLVKLEGDELRSIVDLANSLTDSRPVRIQLYRGGKTRTVSL